jgi:hypothetical protein
MTMTTTSLGLEEEQEVQRAMIRQGNRMKILLIMKDLVRSCPEIRRLLYTNAG